MSTDKSVDDALANMDPPVTDDPLLIQPKNTMPRIDSIWAFVSVDPQDGNEGVCAFQIGQHMMPMIAADPKRLKALTPLAESLALRTGMKIKLVRFTAREEVREL
jgi:hypothetical protein